MISYDYVEPLFLGCELRAGVENVPGQLQAGGQISRGLLLLLLLLMLLLLLLLLLLLMLLLLLLLLTTAALRSSSWSREGETAVHKTKNRR
jgi:hypothetical protein